MISWVITCSSSGLVFTRDNIAAISNVNDEKLICLFKKESIKLSNENPQKKLSTLWFSMCFANTMFETKYQRFSLVCSVCQVDFLLARITKNTGMYLRRELIMNACLCLTRYMFLPHDQSVQLKLFLTEFQNQSVILKNA